MNNLKHNNYKKISITVLIIFILLIIPLSIRWISFQLEGTDINEVKNIILQNKENNCGPVVLKMIFDHYNISSTLSEIEKKVKMNKMGTSMLALKEMSELKGLHAEGWRLTKEDLFKVAFPVILFVNGDHYVVADSAKKDTIYLRDPLFGKIRLRMNNLSERWKGEALVFRK